MGSSSAPTHEPPPPATATRIPANHICSLRQAVGVIERFAASATKAAHTTAGPGSGGGADSDAATTDSAAATSGAATGGMFKGLFMYLGWHNTHTPLECPQEWEYPSWPPYNNSHASRMTVRQCCSLARIRRQIRRGLVVSCLMPCCMTEESEL